MVLGGWFRRLSGLASGRVFERGLGQQMGNDVIEPGGGHRDAGVRGAVVQPELTVFGVMGQPAGEDDARDVAGQLIRGGGAEHPFRRSGPHHGGMVRSSSSHPTRYSAPAVVSRTPW